MNTKRIFATAVLLFVIALFCNVPVFADAGDPPARVMRVSYLQGAVSFEPSGENDWSQATLNYPAASGDRFWTDKDGRAELETGNLAVRMAAQTDLTMTGLTDQLIQLGLAQGTLRIRVMNLRQGNELEVDTPNGALNVTEAGNYRIEVYPDQNLTMLTVNDGQVQITDSSGQEQTVGRGQAVRLTGSNPAQLQAVEVPSADSFDQWCTQRDQRYLTSISRRYVSPEVPGYYDLDQYGSWNTEAAYGPVWYPAGVAAGWVPYRYGRWAWVEPWGWTWVEEEPWGFAPFHYGRWVLIGPRWGWVPGPIAVAPVYGPAFVAFVGGAGFSFGVSIGSVAWFPLGPGEPFYPWYHHSPTYLQQINVTNVRNINVTNITNITNVTNINNVNYRYKTVAATAVPANVFRNAEPVHKNLIAVNPKELAKTPILPHPEIAPDKNAITAGAPVTHPPVHPARPQVLHVPVSEAHVGTPANNARTAPQQSAPKATENRPPANSNEARSSEVTRTASNVPRPPAEEQRAAPQPAEHKAPPSANESRQTEPRGAEKTSGGAPPSAKPPLVARNPPPPEKLSYAQKQPAMQEHPGRPLEPQQKENIKQGKPAGPMQDKEYAPHPPAPHPTSPKSEPAPHNQPAPHGEPTHGKPQ